MCRLTMRVLSRICGSVWRAVGVFSQPLRKFTQRLPGRSQTFPPKRSVFDPAYVLLVHEAGKPKLERLEQRLAAQESRFRENWRITRWPKMNETFSKY
jgi:hypothetical protein